MHKRVPSNKVRAFFQEGLEKSTEKGNRTVKMLRDRESISFYRAGTSVPLNIAEGAGEDAINEKARFYRMARRSATECSSIFDVCQRLGLLDKSRYAQGRVLLLRIVAMLTKMGRAETAYTSPR